jgi:hypothetical protein
MVVVVVAPVWRVDVELLEVAVADEEKVPHVLLLFLRSGRLEDG